MYDADLNSETTIKIRAARSVVWTVLGYGAQRGVLFLSTLVLAHLLHPADFGVVAIASTVIAASSVLRDLGLGDTLIQRPQLDRRAQGTVLTLMLLAGLLMALILAGLAPLLARFFHDARLTGVLLALAPILALGGLYGFYDSVLQRELQYRSRTFVIVCQSGLYVIISIGLAVAGLGVWSLVVAQLVSLSVTAVLLLRLAWPYAVRPRLERAAAREILRAGRAFLVGGAVDFTRQNTDYISIGRFLSTVQLSFYFSAFRICETVGGAMADAFTRISFSSFSRLRAQGVDVSGHYLSTLRLVGLVSCPIGVILSAVAGPFVRVAYGSQWLPMIPVLSVLGVWIAVRVLENVLAWLLISTGQTGLAVRATTLSYGVLLPSVVAAASLSGIVAVAVVMLSYQTVTGLAFAWLLDRRGGLSLANQARTLRPILISCLPAWIAGRAVAELVSPAGLALPLAAGAAGAAYAASLAICGPGLLTWGLRQTRRVFVRDGEATASAELSSSTASAL